ncbi:hypothetical protein CSAL01_10793 [Colletotrichum salicis]|uniref:Uncharacterized protein n=1 Tax=Colletotrichum salicis TaxID=1209931 RepID=A0A135V3L2_9PEZI|nr:hypothetical protein CSAL01_10793 [Colletotrichum salicis]
MKTVVSPIGHADVDASPHAKLTHTELRPTVAAREGRRDFSYKDAHHRHPRPLLAPALAQLWPAHVSPRVGRPITHKIPVPESCLVRGVVVPQHLWPGPRDQRRDWFNETVQSTHQSG